MSRILFLLLLIPVLAQAEDLSEIYWSTYACGGYIYHFDSNKGEYKIYTRLDMKDKRHGEYKTYQLTEGEMKREKGAVYILTSKDIKEAMSIDFSDTQKAIMKSKQFGQAQLIRCDSKKAKQLIKEADKHFETCPKNVLNCKGL